MNTHPKRLSVLGPVLWLGAAALAACSSGPSFECDENTPCGFGEVCQAGQCIEFRCATSAQCPIESYCFDGDCLPGCAEDGDCKTGSSCNLETKQCEKLSCTDSSVDCGYREFCNSATGDCYDAGDQYCRFCNDDSECGEGNLCISHYCGVDCSRGQECPSGFECYGFPDDQGNIVAFQCFTYCWLYEGYEPGSFVKAPPEDTCPVAPDASPVAPPAREGR